MYEQITQSLRQAYDCKVNEREAKDVASWKKQERERFLAKLQAEDKTTLLEVGAGTGNHGLFFQEQGLDVTCTDLSPAMVEACRRKGLKARVVDFLSLDFVDPFDAVFAMNALLHVPKIEFLNVLSTIHHVLRPGGLFYLGQYGGTSFEGIWPDDHYAPKRFFAYYTDEDIKKLVSTVFEEVHFRSVSLQEPGEDKLDFHFQSLVLRA